MFSDVQFSFSRFFNGFNVDFNVTIGDLATEDIVPNNMSTYLAVKQGV